MLNPLYWGGGGGGGGGQSINNYSSIVKHCDTMTS